MKGLRLFARHVVVRVPADPCPVGTVYPVFAAVSPFAYQQGWAVDLRLFLPQNPQMGRLCAVVLERVPSARCCACVCRCAGFSPCCVCIPRCGRSRTQRVSALRPLPWLFRVAGRQQQHGCHDNAPPPHSLTILALTPLNCGMVSPTSAPI
ncbi:MAG: hypothetical protein IJT39_05030 [Bacteroidales bacterium]|nr:hypothetical protein [Bacteroidales bacterium]